MKQFLKDIVAFVDVSLEGEEVQRIVERLESMGATVLSKWKQSASHVIWYKGKNLRAFEKAVNAGDPIAVIVSYEWVDRCFETQKRCEESDFMVPIDPNTFLPKALEPKPNIIPKKLITEESNKSVSKKRSLKSGKENKRKSTKHIPQKRKKVLIAASSCSDASIDVLLGITGEIGNSSFIEDETAEFTHLVLGEHKRTLKVLFAIARGAWILEPSFLWEALEHSQWPDELQYESTCFKGSKLSRLDSLRCEGKSSLFKGTCIFIQVQNVKGVSKSILQELVGLCGGTVVSYIAEAEICIASEEKGKILSKKYAPITVVKPSWLFTSIAEYTKVPFDDHLYVQRMLHECPLSPGV